MSFYYWKPYVPVAKRRAAAQKKLKQLHKRGKTIQPVEIVGRAIATSFWGKAWCEHLESFSDFENRLPRGRTYVRNGSVCHLAIEEGRIEAHVSGSSLYTVTIQIKPLKPAAWKGIQTKCRGQIGSMLELLEGKLSDQVMRVVSNRDDGLFPKPKEIEMRCSCPDWATMCKHVAAVLYGVGHRLDSQPELLFKLRKVDAGQLITAGIAMPAKKKKAVKAALGEAELADVFGIEMDSDMPAQTANAGQSPAKNIPPKKDRKTKTLAKHKAKTLSAPQSPTPKRGRPKKIKNEP